MPPFRRKRRGSKTDRFSVRYIANGIAGQDAMKMSHPFNSMLSGGRLRGIKRRVTEPNARFAAFRRQSLKYPRLSPSRMGIGGSCGGRSPATAQATPFPCRDETWGHEEIGCGGPGGGDREVLPGRTRRPSSEGDFRFFRGAKPPFQNWTVWTRETTSSDGAPTRATGC